MRTRQPGATGGARRGARRRTASGPAPESPAARPRLGTPAFRVACGTDPRPASVSVHTFDETTGKSTGWGGSGYEGIYYDFVGVDLPRSYWIELADLHTHGCILFLEGISVRSTPHFCEAGKLLDDGYVSDDDVRAMPVVHLGGARAGFPGVGGCWKDR